MTASAVIYKHRQQPRGFKSKGIIMRFVELVGETRDGKEVVCDVQERYSKTENRNVYDAKCYDENKNPIWTTVGNACSWDSIYGLAFSSLICMSGARPESIHIDIDDEM